jgi:hypothetical protein
MEKNERKNLMSVSEVFWGSRLTGSGVHMGHETSTNSDLPSHFQMK